MLIRTKIVATLGPASGELSQIRRLVEAGVDVFRINFSHGDNSQHEQYLDTVRRVEKEAGTPLGVFGDLCGPKIRTGQIEGGSVLLQAGEQIVLQAEPITGNSRRISISRRQLPREVRRDETILIDDGRIALQVVQAGSAERFLCNIVHGGRLSSHKGVNLPHTQLKLSALTDKDRRDAAWIASRPFDYVALSFVRSRGDIDELRDLLDENDCQAGIIAKIEKPQAVENIESILEATDAVMVARGDLGVEMDLHLVPVAQKRISLLAQQHRKPCIIATQMLESMTTSATPTRAEVSDVANAVLDRADAVMLSGETAVGNYPIKAVEMMNRVVQEVQAYHDETCVVQREDDQTQGTTGAIAKAVHGIVQTGQARAVAVYTATGTSARLLAKSRLGCSILAMAPSVEVARRASLYYGVQSVQADAPSHTRDILKLASGWVKRLGLARTGDKIVVVSGRPIGSPGATNTLVVHAVD